MIISEDLWKLWIPKSPITINMLLKLALWTCNLDILYVTCHLFILILIYPASYLFTFDLSKYLRKSLYLSAVTCTHHNMITWWKEMHQINSIIVTDRAWRAINSSFTSIHLNDTGYTGLYLSQSKILLLGIIKSKIDI